MEIMASAELHTILYVTIWMIIGISQNLASGSNSDFTYPQGIIPCKTHNETSLDCSNRRLTDIPPLDQNSTTRLNLSHNELIEISGKPFQNLPLLIQLDLSYNAISTISTTAFAGLKTLKFLHVRDNKLVSLPQDIFMNLEHLIHIDMSNNLFTKVPPSLDWTYLQSLRYLRVFIAHNENPTSMKIDQGFQKLTNLSKLYVYAHKLSSNVTKSTFQYLSGLPIKLLLIHWQPLDTKIFIEHGISISLPNLRELYVPYKAFKAIDFLCLRLRVLLLISTDDAEEPKTLTASSLKNLAQWNETLSYLTIALKTERILNFTFECCPLLKLLSLEKNNIIFLSKYVFSGLDHLKHLILADSSLKAVPSHTFIAFQNGSLQILDLSANKIDKIAPNAFSFISRLKYLKLADNSIKSLGGWISIFTNLILLDVSCGTANNPYGKHFKSSSSSLQILKVNDAEAIDDLPGNMCSLFPNLQIVTLANIKYGIKTSLAIHNCHQLVELDLSYSIQSWNFGKNRTCLENLQSLYLAGNGLTSMDQVLFIEANLTSLDVSKNSLQTIEDNDLLSFPYLHYLNLKDNSLTSIEGLRYLRFLLYLNVAENQLTAAPAWMFKGTILWISSLKILDLSKNPFHCNCDIQTFREWILSDTKTYLTGVEYVCATQHAFEGKSITAIELDCQSKDGFYISISIPIVILTLVLLSLLIKYRWHIKYRLHLLFRKYYTFPDLNDELEMKDMNEPLQYHAYVAYNDNSRQDEAWVRNILQPNIEEGPEPFQLCIKSRDFIPGYPLVETISKRIQQSRRTILVLTPQFVESEWCYHEMQMAQMLLFQEERDVLVLVLLESIPELKITISLRHILCKKRCLKWPKDRVGQNLFWRTLREELKAPAHINRRCDF